MPLLSQFVETSVVIMRPACHVVGNLHPKRVHGVNPTLTPFCIWSSSILLCSTAPSGPFCQQRGEAQEGGLDQVAWEEAWPGEGSGRSV